MYEAPGIVRALGPVVERAARAARAQAEIARSVRVLRSVIVALDRLGADVALQNVRSDVRPTVATARKGW